MPRTDSGKSAVEKMKRPRIAVRVDGLQKKLKDFSDTLEKYEPQRKKFINAQLQHAKTHFSKAKSDLVSAYKMCERVRSRAVSARNNARKLSSKTNGSWNPDGTSQTSKLAAKIEYLNPIIENLKDIEENLGKIWKAFNKTVVGVVEKIDPNKFYIPGEVFTSLYTLNEELKGVKEKAETQSLPEVEINSLDETMNKIEERIKKIGEYTYDPAYKAFQTGVTRVVSKDYISDKTISVSGASMPSEQDCGKGEGVEKLQGALEKTKVNLSSNFGSKNTTAKKDVTYLQAVECLGSIDGLSIKVSEYAKGIKKELKEYSAQVDHLLVTVRGMARLAGKVIYKLLPAIVGCAAGVSGFIGALEETFVETIGWLSSAIGYGMFDVEGLAGDLEGYTEMISKLADKT